MSRSQLSLSTLLMVALVACSEGTTTPPVGGGGSGITAIALSPVGPVLTMGTTRVLTARATNAAGAPVTATLTWTTSLSSVATVSSAGLVSAVAPGIAIITAASGAVNGAVTVTVTDNVQWPATGASPSTLIAAAVASGALTAEQGLVYRVFASFGDQRLPAAFRGPAEGNAPDDPILKEVSSKLSTLSAATRELLAPFFIPLPYEGSWYAARHPADPANARATSSTSLASLAAAPGSKANVVACNFMSWHQSVTTQHFRIHYDSWGATDQLNQAVFATRDIVVAEIEKIYAAVTGALGREPLPDANATTACNGGDGLVDIYIMNIIAFGMVNPGDVKAKTDPYVLGGCDPIQSKITIPGTGQAVKTRNALAHELVHVLEFGSYSRGPANCFDDYYWMGEATGNWAMDLVYGKSASNDNVEQPYAEYYMDSERFVPIDLGFDGNAKKTNGYSDYVFMLYLAKKYDATAIKAIWDATESASGNSVTALQNGLASRGGLRKVWPEFALALWNDVEGQNQDDFKEWDGLTWGLKRYFELVDGGNIFGYGSIEVDKKGAPKKGFELLEESGQTAGGHELPRLTIHTNYLKFTDSDVASVIYMNALALADFPDLKIQAMVKKGGQWQAAEDWTKKTYKNFCRDVKDERIDELVLIYSNADFKRPSPGIPFMFLPRVNVSNVGCFKWQGTSSIDITVTGPVPGSSTTSSSGLVFERVVEPQLPDGGAGSESFEPKLGAISGNSSTACITSTAAGTVSALDGNLLINLDIADFGSFAPPPDRQVLQGIGSSTLTTNSIHCTLGAIVGEIVWSWLEIPALESSSVVSADGRTIEGNVTQTLISGTQVLKWKLTAVREP